MGENIRFIPFVNKLVFAVRILAQVFFLFKPGAWTIVRIERATFKNAF
jgi:hypothetical protein